MFQDQMLDILEEILEWSPEKVEAWVIHEFFEGVSFPDVPTFGSIYRVLDYKVQFRFLRELGAPPKEKCRWGRLNAPGESIFYGTTSKLLGIWEISRDIFVGKYYHVLKCELKDQSVNSIGFGFPERAVFIGKNGERVSYKDRFWSALEDAKNQNPAVDIEKSWERNLLCNAFFNDSLARIMTMGDRRYKFTRAVGQFLLRHPAQIFLYPTVKNLESCAVNFALLGDTVFEYLNYLGVEKYKVKHLPDMNRMRSWQDCCNEECRCLELVDVAEIRQGELFWARDRAEEDGDRTP